MAKGVRFQTEEEEAAENSVAESVTAATPGSLVAEEPSAIPEKTQFPGDNTVVTVSADSPSETAVAPVLQSIGS